MNKPSISIIVPVYNVEPYVEDCIRSVMRQTYDGPIECTVVDDCGTDNSMAVVERIIAEYTGPITFKVLHHEFNRGLSAARNTGIDSATGDYLFFLDSDDEITDDCIDKMMKPLLSESYDFVIGDMIKVDSNYREMFTTAKLRLSDNTILRNEYITKGHSEIMWSVAAWNKLYSSDFIHRYQIRFYEGLIHEDVLWTFQIVCLAQSLYAVNSVTYFYKRRDASIMNSSSLEKRVQSYIISICEMCKFYKEKGLNNEYAIQIILNNFYYTFQLCLKHFLLYIRTYKRLRPFTKELFEKVKSRKTIRDIHYYLPSMVASLWLYCYDIIIASKRKLSCKKP